MFSYGQEPLTSLGLMFQPHNKDKEAKDALLYASSFKLVERVSTACKRNNDTLDIFQIRSFTHSKQPMPVQVILTLCLR